MIHYKHTRHYDDKDKLSATGGKTIAIEQDGINYKVGIAECSKKDHYNKKTGRAIAASRLGNTLLPRQTLEDVLLAKAFFQPLNHEGYEAMIKSLPTESISVSAIFEILLMLERK